MAVNGLGVIFDVDGVLVDSYQAHFESWHRAAERFKLQMTEENFARTFGRTSREIIEQLWPGRFDDEQKRELDRLKESDYRDIIAEHFPEMPGAGDLIATLNQAGFKLAIGSSGPPENVELVRRTIRHGEMISAAVNGTDVKHGKPDPEVFLTAAKKLGLEPAKCAVVEDASVGLQAARRAGMAAIGLTGTADRAVLQSHAHLVVDSLRELTPEIIAKLIARR